MKRTKEKDEGASREDENPSDRSAVENPVGALHEIPPRMLNALKAAFNGKKKRSAESCSYEEYDVRDLRTAEKTLAWVYSDEPDESPQRQSV
jgi:hypothetical protein